jgi:hypothetical protein
MTGNTVVIEVDADHYFASTEMKATSTIGFTGDCTFSVLETRSSLGPYGEIRIRDGSVQYEC